MKWSKVRFYNFLKSAFRFLARTCFGVVMRSRTCAKAWKQTPSVSVRVTVFVLFYKKKLSVLELVSYSVAPAMKKLLE